MIETKIQAFNLFCHKCRNLFGTNEVLLRSNDGSNIYCSNCFHKTFPESEINEQLYAHIMYRVEHGTGKLILNPHSTQKLENNVYCIKQAERFFVVDSVGTDNTLTQKSTEIRKDQYLLEKKNQDYFLLFPQKIQIPKYLFCDVEDTLGHLVHYFQPCFDYYSQVRFACNSEERIIGLTNAESTWKHLDIAALYTQEELISQYKDNVPEQYMNMLLKQLTPQKMLQYCQERIHGQGKQLKIAVYQIYKYMVNALSGKEFCAANWILTAPSGAGKTEFYRAIRDLFKLYKIPIPVVQIDLSQITEAGFKGQNASAIPKQILIQNPNTTGMAICFLDEADKKMVPCYESHGNNVNAAVQSNLLTLVEGSELMVEMDDEKLKDFNSNYTMFILLGAFQDIRKQKHQKKHSTNQLGFAASAESLGNTINTDFSSEEFYEDLVIQDLVDYGMLEELAGRMEQVVNFHKLSKDDMRNLLRDKTKQISKELEINIELTESGLEALLEISFGTLGVRRPMNIISSLAQNTVAEAFFDDAFDNERDKVVITALDTAHIERPAPEEPAKTSSPLFSLGKIPFGEKFKRHS